MAFDSKLSGVRSAVAATYPKDDSLTSGQNLLIESMHDTGLISVTTSATAPPGPSVDDLWYMPDTGLAANLEPNGDAVLYRWDGAAWQPMTPQQFSQYLFIESNGAPKFVTYHYISGVYVPSSPDIRAIEVELVAPGGGGGGVDGQGSDTAACALGGHSGERVIKFIEIADASTYTATLTIGAPGVGGAAGNNNGSDGGDVTYDDGTLLLTALGGIGGTGRLGTSAVSLLTSGNSTIPASGDINIPTQRPSDANMLLGNIATRSSGGPSPYGSPQRPGNNASVSASLGYNAGGTGASTQDTIGNYGGGDAAPGFIMVKEY